MKFAVHSSRTKSHNYKKITNSLSTSIKLEVRDSTLHIVHSSRTKSHNYKKNDQ